ncbi:hypothetical protein [Streptomyces sp. NPDC056452]|uniref:hypothetical protein n=1 Tax=Streptomyces sp. NPDC056452 TaxID=3345821 RepID=UPI0036CDD6D7
MSPTVELRVGRRTIDVKRAEKELFPHDGVTKADLAEHYRRVAPRMLPSRSRPEAAGIAAKCKWWRL